MELTEENIEAFLDLALRPCVLIVNEERREGGLAGKFEARGFYVMTADSNRVCSELFESVKPDVVVSSETTVDCGLLMDDMEYRFKDERPVYKSYGADVAEEQIVHDASKIVEGLGLFL